MSRTEEAIFSDLYRSDPSLLTRLVRMGEFPYQPSIALKVCIKLGFFDPKLKDKNEERTKRYRVLASFMRDSFLFDEFREEFLAHYLEAIRESVGKANCGCVHHAEEGIPCEHDLALAGI